jgi:hypothetical protein
MIFRLDVVKASILVYYERTHRSQSLGNDYRISLTQKNQLLSFSCRNDLALSRTLLSDLIHVYRDI